MRENGKLCILRLSAIGDVCHAVALVERIQRTRPDIEITWVIGKVEHLLVGDMPGVRFVVFDKKQGRQAYWDLRAALKGIHFDVLFVMQVALRANIASLFIRAKIKVGFDKKRSKELHHWFVSEHIAPQQHPHVLEGFMGFADAVSIPSGGPPRWHIPIPEAAQRRADDLLQALGQYLVISPSASKAERNWTLTGYQMVAQFAKQHGYAVVLCGGPSDAERALGQSIASEGLVDCNLIGQTNLKELVAILSKARLVVAPDTGPAHMATAAGTPVLGLYAHSNPRRTGPYLSQASVVSVYDEVIEEQQGKPWQSLPWGIRAKGSDLMNRISEQEVRSQLEAQLSEP